MSSGSASSSAVLQRADAGQELDQRADVAGLGAGGGRCWPGCTRWCWWSGWVSAWSPGSRAAGEYRDDGHRTSRASRSTVLQRADAGQELDQRADVAGLGAGGRAGCWRGRRIEGRRRAPGRRPRDQPGQRIDRAAACRHWPGCNPPEEECRPGTRPACRRGRLGAGGGLRWPGCTRWCWWSGWVSAWSSGSRATGEHRDEGHGISRASRSTVLQRADAGQELDQLADVAGLGVGAVAGIEGRRRAPGRRPRDQPGQQIDRASAC
jgi:hypothetical protein